jgi:hypothetical protein
MSRKEIYLQWISCMNRWRTCRRKSASGRASALPRNLICRHPCRSQITSVGSEAPLSLDPLHGGWRDGKAEKQWRRKWVSFQRDEWTVRDLLYTWRLLYILKDPFCIQDISYIYWKTQSVSDSICPNSRDRPLKPLYVQPIVVDVAV